MQRLTMVNSATRPALMRDVRYGRYGLCRRRAMGCVKDDLHIRQIAQRLKDERAHSTQSRPPLPQPSGGTAIDRISRSRMTRRRLAR